MTRVKISVVIPCFNLGAYLDEAIDSCLAQNRGDLEILVIDDGSTEDATRALLDDLCRPKTRVIRTPNRGQAAARNLGADKTTGDLLCFLDADDLLEPRFFASTVAALESDTRVSFASCWIEAFGEESWFYRPERCGLSDVLAECTVATPALVCRPAFEAVGGFDENMPALGNEDWDLWIHLLAKGFQGVIVPEILFRYRRRRGSAVEESYYGATYLVLMDYQYRKYADLYNTHLAEVLAQKDHELDELEANRRQLHTHLEQSLRPALNRRVVNLPDPDIEGQDPSRMADPVDLGALMEGAPYPRELMARDERLLALRRLTQEMERERLAIEAELARQT